MGQLGLWKMCGLWLVLDEEIGGKKNDSKPNSSGI